MKSYHSTCLGRSSIFRFPIVFVLLAAIYIGWVSPAPAVSDEKPIQIGFTKNVFINSNENDVLAAMKVWAQTLSEEYGIEITSDFLVFHSTDAAAEAIRTAAVDAITMSLPEYAEFPEGLLSGPFVANESGGSTYVEFVLLGAKKDNLSGIEHLSGAKLSIHDDRNIEMARLWLNAECAKAGLGPVRTIVASLENCKKLSTSVLNVFFGKSDACLVSRNGFNNMAELNPQIAAKLLVISASPTVLPNFFAFRATLPETRKMKLSSAIQKLHETVQGKQVLSLFKSEKMKESTIVEVERSLMLIKAWRDASEDQPIKTAKLEGGAE